jgi:hypothetical protein
MSYGTPEWQGWVLNEEEGLKHIKVAFVFFIYPFRSSKADSIDTAMTQVSIPSIQPMCVYIEVRD